MNDDDGPAAGMILSISPEPTQIERDAIVAALVVLWRRRQFVVPTIDDGPTTWQAMARREGIGVGSRDRG